MTHRREKQRYNKAQANKIFFHFSSGLILFDKIYDEISNHFFHLDEFSVYHSTIDIATNTYISIFVVSFKIIGDILKTSLFIFKSEFHARHDFPAGYARQVDQDLTCHA
jgi:hypothetical protein